MKGLLWYIAVVMMTVCVGLAGCGPRKVDARLAQVNELANAGETDSAMMVLSSIEKQSLNEHNRRYYDLMSIKTRDKAYQDITGDTVITDIIDYFDGNGSDYEKGEAYYYGGRVYREMGDAPQALDYFQKALDAFPEDEAMMKGKTASQMGQIFLNMYMFEHAKPKFQEAIRYQKDCKDSVGQILNLRVLGDVYQELDIVDSALWCFKQALKLNSKSDSNLKRKIDIKSSIIDLYVSQGDYDKARQEFVEFDTLSNGFKYDYVLHTRINMYIILKQYGKVQKSAQELTKSKSIDSRQFAYSVLANYAKFIGDEEKTYDFVMKYFSCQTGINKNASRTAVIHQNSLYNYALREKESNILRYNQQILKQKISIITISLLVVICLFLFAMYRNRKLKLQLSLQINNLMKIQKEDFYDNIVNNENVTITELEIEYNKEYNKLIQNVEPENYVIPETILSSKIYNQIKQSLNTNKTITSSDWHKLDVLINNVHKSFTLKLYQLNTKISKHEYQICLLTKCKFSNTDISCITNRERSSITKAKIRLYIKLFNRNGNAKEFDRFILSL